MNTESVRDEPIRVLLAKPQHDVHDRGVRLVAKKMRDAGFEVVFINFLLPEEVVRAAVPPTREFPGHQPMPPRPLFGLQTRS